MGAGNDRKSYEGEGFDSSSEWTVGDILRAMAGGDIPRYIERLASQVQEWMISALSGEGELSAEDYLFGFGDRKQGDPEALISSSNGSTSSPISFLPRVSPRDTRKPSPFASAPSISMRACVWP